MKCVICSQVIESMNHEPESDTCNNCKSLIDEEKKHTLGDYDIWYKPCERCGYDTAKSTKRSPNKCWRCGNIIYRDYSKRALKTKRRKKCKS